MRKAALAILETQWKTPYHYDLFQGDVGHTLVLGATGAGNPSRLTSFWFKRSNTIRVFSFSI